MALDDPMLIMLPEVEHAAAVVLPNSFTEKMSSNHVAVKNNYTTAEFYLQCIAKISYN